MTLPPMSENPGVTAAPRRGLLRRLLVWTGIACFTAIVFVVALIVTMPVSALRGLVALPPQITDLRGTLWQGRAMLTDGYVLNWEGRLGGIILARLAADVTLQGSDTLLTGRIEVSPRTFRLDDLSGRAGPGLLALANDLPVTDCTSRLTVDAVSLSWRPGAATAGGGVAVSAGTCLDFGGDPVPVPDMTVALTTQGNDAVADLTGADGALARVVVAGDRRLLIRVEPAGARLVPGMPASGPTVLEYPF